MFLQFERGKVEILANKNVKLSELHFPCPVGHFSYNSLFKVLTFCILLDVEQFVSGLRPKILDRFAKTIFYVSGG